jgi:hypothetical protein
MHWLPACIAAQVPCISVQRLMHGTAARYLASHSGNWMTTH